MRCLRTALAAVTAALTLLAGPAAAHDSWFAPLPPTGRGEPLLALGTGNLFPTLEVPIGLDELQTQGCRGDGQRWAPMRWVADRPAALLLRAPRPLAATATLSCAAQLRPIDIEIDNPIVEIYLDEVRALPAVRARWAALRERGVRWQERYVKHARIELAGAAAERSGEAAATAAIEGLGMDARVESARRPLRAGDTLRAQLLRDGQPLAGQPVELRNDLSPLGLWRTTDAEGRIEITLPLAARWLLRAVDLQPSARHPDHWDSRFLTLAFEVLPSARSAP